MRAGKKIYGIILIGMSIIFFWDPKAFSVTAEDIAQELTCLCGCNMVVNACEGTMECGPAAEIKNQIVAMLNMGRSKEEILAFFVHRHGEKILSSPTKRGFNLTAWLLPFVAVIFGIGMLYTVLRSWAARKKPIHEQASFTEEDRIYLEEIEKELKTFES